MKERIIEENGREIGRTKGRTRNGRTVSNWDRGRLSGINFTVLIKIAKVYNDLLRLIKIAFDRNKMTQSRERTRHRANRTHLQPAVPRVAQILSSGREYGAFLGDGPNSRQPQSLADMNNVLSQFHSKINDFAREEVLLKP